MERWRKYRHPNSYRTEQRAEREPKKRWRPSPWVLLIGLVLLAIGGLIWFVVGSSFFVIKTVRASGEVTPPIEEHLNQLKGQHLLFLKETDVFQSLEIIDPSIASIHLVKGLPDTVQVQAVRRHPALIWQSGEEKWAIDPTGVAFGLDPTTADGVPVVIDRSSLPVKPGIQLVSPDFVNFTRQALTDVPAHISGKVIEAFIEETTFHLHLKTEEGWQIILDTTRALPGELKSLDLVLKDHKGNIHEYLDLRLAGWAYLK